MGDDWAYRRGRQIRSEEAIGKQNQVKSNGRAASSKKAPANGAQDNQIGGQSRRERMGAIPAGVGVYAEQPRSDDYWNGGYSELAGPIYTEHLEKLRSESTLRRPGHLFLEYIICRDKESQRNDPWRKYREMYLLKKLRGVCVCRFL